MQCAICTLYMHPALHLACEFAVVVRELPFDCALPGHCLLLHLTPSKDVHDS